MNSSFKRIEEWFKGRSLLWVELFGGGSLSVGRETVRPGDGYHWDGLQRPADPNDPQWLFQYSLRGWGLLETKRSRQLVEAGRAFLVEIPSAHLYRADPLCPEWEFLWIMIRLPEAHLRLARHPSIRNRTLALTFESPPIQKGMELVRACAENAGDFQVESRLFDWVLTLERAIVEQRHPNQARQALLRRVREMLLADLTQPFDVEALAASQRMSRSNFSHHFKKITGLTPAHYLRQIRLEAAAAQLHDRTLSIKEIAVATGFQDSNTFCKAFRRQYRMSTGEYRRLAGVASR